MIRVLEELGVRQAGGGGLGVDQPVEETGLGSGKSLGREQANELGMDDKGGRIVWI